MDLVVHLPTDFCPGCGAPFWDGNHVRLLEALPNGLSRYEAECGWRGWIWWPTVKEQLARARCYA